MEGMIHQLVSAASQPCRLNQNQIQVAEYFAKVRLRVVQQLFRLSNERQPRRREKVVGEGRRGLCLLGHSTLRQEKSRAQLRNSRVKSTRIRRKKSEVHLVLMKTKTQYHKASHQMGGRRRVVAENRVNEPCPPPPPP